MKKVITVRNAGFNRPFLPYGGDGHLKVADGWAVRWHPGLGAGQGFLVRPECYVKTLHDITGQVIDVCQGIQTTNATHVAAFVQAVDLPVGVGELLLEARVGYNTLAGGMAVRVGLDGTGQTLDINATTIQWGSWLNQDGDPPWGAGKWSVAKARLAEVDTGYVSIWLQSQNKWRNKNNHVFWRDVSLTAEGAGPDPEPDPAGAAGKIMAAIDLLLDAVALL
jgi:hypothetical protein